MPFDIFMTIIPILKFVLIEMRDNSNENTKHYNVHIKVYVYCMLSLRISI